MKPKRKKTQFNKRNSSKNMRRDSEVINTSRKELNSDEEKFESKSVGKRMNDPSWYYKSERVLDDVASFSFNKSLGTSLRFDRFMSDTQYFTVSQMFAAVPGILAINLAITPGIANNAQDPINLGATNLYSYVRHQNSGSRNYDSPDLMMYMYAMDSIYSCWNWLKRLYGMASTYSAMNRYEPKGWFEAENVDFDDIIGNLADFRGWLNLKANEIKSFCVPSVMTLNVRHAWLFSSIFKDSNTRKAQTYMYVPSLFYKYDETSSEKGGQLVPIVLNNYGFNTSPTSKMKLNDLKRILNDMLEAVNYSEDIGIMSGDILKAYGEGGLYTLSEIDPAYKVEPAFSQEVLTQIENCVIADFKPEDAASFTVTQDPDTNFLKFNPYTTSQNNQQMEGRFLNFHWDNPTPADVIVATRLNACLERVKGGTYKANVVDCGSEIPTKILVVTNAQSNKWDSALDPTNYNLQPVVSIINYYTLEVVDPTQTVEQGCSILGKLSSLNAFDWAPMNIYMVTDNAGVGDPTRIIGTTWDWDVYTYIDDTNMRAINSLALLSEFNVPN